MISYSEKLRDTRWQRRRLEIMQQYAFTCARCASSEKTLNVHHRVYRRGADPWDYPDEHLICVCEDCHRSEHEAQKAITAMMAFGDPRELVSLCAGFLLSQGAINGKQAEDLTDGNFDNLLGGFLACALAPACHWGHGRDFVSVVDEVYSDMEKRLSHGEDA